VKVGWEQVRLGDVLERSQETMNLEPDTIYREVTVKWWGKGAVVRREVSGSGIAGSSRFVARSGQFIVSRIDARQGAADIIPSNLEGAIVTNDFPLFNLDTSRLFPGFFRLYTRTADFTDLAKRSSEGTTNRIRLVERLFLDSVMPLPPLEEQKRIVARVEGLMAKVDEARELREQARIEREALGASYLSQTFDNPSWENRAIQDISDVKGGIQKSSARTAGANPRRYLTVAHVQRNKIDIGDPRYFEVTEEELERWRLDTGDVLVIEGNGSADQVGRSAVFRAK